VDTPPDTRTLRRRRIFLAGLIPGMLGAILTLYPPAALTRLDFTVYDTLLRAADPEPPLGRVVIVDIDDRSLSAIGRWPWRRDVIARLIGRLDGMGARTIALNVIFAEPDREQGLAASDALLAEALKDARVVVGHAFTFDRAAAGSRRCVLHPLRVTVVQPAGATADIPLFRAAGALCSLPVLGEAAGTSGFLNAAPDVDGILRRVPLVLAFNGETYPALALAAVAATSDQHTGELRQVNANTMSLTLDDRKIPLDGRGNLLLRYRGRLRTFPYVSAADVLDGQLPADTFRDKIVFVGATALGIQEQVATPYDPLFSGAEVQATVADNLLRGDFIRRPEHAVLLQVCLGLALTLGIVLLMARVGVKWGGVAAVACLVVLWGTSAWLLVEQGMFLSPLLSSGVILIAVVAASGMAMAHDVRVASSELQRARHETASATGATNEFLRTVSHELRTPLSVILGYTQMLAKGALRDEQQSRALASVERNARAQTQLIDDLLVASQSAAGKLRLDVKSIRLGEVVRAVVDDTRPAIDAKRITLHAAIDDELGPIVGDGDRLRQVVWNLLSNAIKFTPEGGRVDIGLERVASHAVLAVTDSGPGIAPELLPHVFQQFRHHDSAAIREHGGLGLGLALARHVVELHGGSIDAENSGGGRGATFRVRLPLGAAPAVASQTDASPAGTEYLDRIRVLVADDRAEARALVASALLKAGARVVTAASARDALAILRDETRDVLAVSLDMPNDDGFRLAEEARALTAARGGRLRIVALGGAASAERLMQFRQAGIDRYLAKPVEPEHLVSVIATLRPTETRPDQGPAS
jgi:signal transduction histidine kinase/ActR/RegA family two-component response regulator